jgi:hypothetical protein
MNFLVHAFSGSLWGRAFRNKEVRPAGGLAPSTVWAWAKIWECTGDCYLILRVEASGQNRLALQINGSGD